MPKNPQEWLELIIEDDLERRRPVKEVARDLRESGYSAFVRPYVTWRKWDRHRDSINAWRRTKRLLRQFLAVRPVPLALFLTLVVLVFHLPDTRPTALSWGEAVGDLVTPERALWAAAGILVIVVLYRLLRVAVETWELRHSDDARLAMEESFITDSGVRVKIPHQLFMAMSQGGGSRLARIAFSTNLTRTSYGRQDLLDQSLRTPRGMRLMEKWERRLRQ